MPLVGHKLRGDENDEEEEPLLSSLSADALAQLNGNLHLLQ